MSLLSFVARVILNRLQNLDNRHDIVSSSVTGEQRQPLYLAFIDPTTMTMMIMVMMMNRKTMLSQMK